ncbi:MAG TPA: V-type ATP synthase subunit C, partial [Firmicutes bacterium]|nr:V-type ATP synthase subunit C [Bacillota bacterium]
EGLADAFQSTDYAGMLLDGIKRYAEEGVLSKFERDSDNFLMEYLKGAKYIPFGPEPVISYLLAKENEVQTLRMLLIGKANGLPGAVIRERLRDTYV